MSGRRAPPHTTGEMERATISSNQVEELEVIDLKIVYDASVTTSGSISSEFKIQNPAATTNWTSLANVYDLYRVETCFVQYFPQVFESAAAWVSNNPAPVSTFPLVIAVDWDSETQTGLSTDQVFQYDTSRVFNMGEPWELKINVPRYANTDIQGWNETGSPNNTGILLLRATNSMADSTGIKKVGKLFITYRTTFKAVNQ